MTPGTYCVPRNRQEWEAILRLADSLGLLWRKPFEELVLGEVSFIAIDPKASPTNIPFEIALAYLKVGRKIKRNEDEDKSIMSPGMFGSYPMSITWPPTGWCFLNEPIVCSVPELWSSRNGQTAYCVSELQHSVQWHKVQGYKVHDNEWL